LERNNTAASILDNGSGSYEFASEIKGSMLDPNSDEPEAVVFK
jgi:hypothetical protein